MLWPPRITRVEGKRRPPPPPETELRTLATLILQRQLEELKLMSQMSDAVTQLTTDVAAMRGEVNSAMAFAQGVPALIATATAEAVSRGATPEQVQALTDLHTALAAEVGDLHTAFAVTPPTV